MAKKPFKFDINKAAKLKPLDYPTKILVAWGEAISGNKKIRDWLTKNGYPELGMFVFALYNKDDARLWLIENGYAHLMAMINGGEGNENAIKWLLANGYDVLAYMAMHIDRDKKAHSWLVANDHKVFAFLAHKMRIVKDTIDDDNHDPHQINFY